LHALGRKPADLTRYADVLAAGYRVGLRAGPLMNTRWEEQFDRPLADLRLEHGVA
jgi:ubiquinone biosynthesis protein Coq4